MRLASYTRDDRLVAAVVVGSRLLDAAAALSQTSAGPGSADAEPRKSMRQLVRMPDTELLELQGAAESIVDGEGIDIDEATLGRRSPTGPRFSASASTLWSINARAKHSGSRPRKRFPIDVEIDGLGCLSNPVAAPDDPFLSQLEKKE